MKKILSLVLVAVLCLGIFAACSNEKEPVAKGPSIEDAKSYLFNMYKDNAEAPSSDYDLVAKVIIDGTTFDVTWAASIDQITITESKRESFWTVDLPFKNETETPYTLTATIKSASGETIELSFERKLPLIDNTGVVTDPEEGVAYKFFLNHVTLGNILYAIDKTQSDNKYIESTIKPAEGLDFYAEKADGGYKFYTTISGAKTYVYAKTVDNNGKISKYLGYSTEEGTVWTYKSDVNAWLTEINGVKYVVGTYGTYNTFCISEASYITPDNSGVSQFPAHLMIKEIAESLAPAEGPTIYTTPENIINAAYELELGGALSAGHKYTLTGVITSIDTAWDASYGNITVTMVVGNMTDKPIQAFRLKGEGADALEVGDKITVTGDIIKYDNKTETGKVELNAGCTLDAVVKASSLPTTPAEIVDAAYALEKGGKLDGTYTLTGKITSVDIAWSDQYKNITVTIAVEGKEDKPIQAFRLKGEGAEGLAVGDTITVTGEIINYADSSEKGKVEFNSGCTVSNIVKAEGTTPETPDTPDVPAPHTHAWDGGKVTKEATCKEEGVKTYTCACGETKTEKIAKTTAHTYKDGVCSVCGAKDPNYVAPVADTYLVVANDKWSIIASGEIEVTGGETMGTNGIAYAKCNYNKDYIVASDIADDFNFLIVIKLSDVAAYKAGTLDESKILLVPQEDEAGTWVGQEVTVEFNADKTPKAVKKTGKSVVGEVTISESNGKYTVKVGDTVYLNGADASAKLATSALEYLTHNNTYFVTRNKFRPFVGQQVMVDLQVIFGNAEFDVTKVGNFYNEFINLNRNMVKVVGYDWDGDKALDAVVLNDATCVKVGAGALSANGDLAIQICSSNMGYYKDGWWNGGTVNKANLVMDSSLTVAEGDYVMLMGDHMTQTTTVTLTGEVTGVLSAVDWEKKTITIGGTVYGMACDGEGPYGYALNKTRWDWPDYNWASLLNTEITVRTDGKYVCATLK